MIKKLSLGLCATLLFFSACQPKKVQQQDSLLSISPTGPNASLPFLYSDASGVVFLSWVEQTDSIDRLLFSSTTGEQWTTPKEIAKSNHWFVNWADYPMIISDGNGHLAAHVLEKTGPEKFSYSIKIFLSDNQGETWTKNFLLNTDTVEGEHGFVSAAVYQNDWFFAWLDGRNAGSGHEGHDGHHGSMTLRGALVAKDGTRKNEWLLDPKTCDCCQTTAVATDQGVTVFYRDRSDEEIRDMSFVHFNGGSWTDPKNLSVDQWKIQGCPVNGPRAIADKNFTGVAWFTGAADAPRVNFASSPTVDMDFNNTIRLDEGNTSGRVDIESLSNGKFAVSFLEGDEIKLRVITKEGQPEKIISVAKTTTGRKSGFPQMTRAGDGLLFAWTDEATGSIRTKWISEP